MGSLHARDDLVARGWCGAPIRDKVFAMKTGRFGGWGIAMAGALAVACGPDGASGVGAATARRAEAVEAPANTWSPAGTMTQARVGQTATRLGSGLVLVAGGQSATAELYDPSTGTWTATGSMSTARDGATATLLPSGLVLVAGGCCAAGGAGLKTAELYDPSTGAFSRTGSLHEERTGHAASLLADGRVLVTGGACVGKCDNSAVDSIASAEIYDPSTGAWTEAAPMHGRRELHTSTLLSTGQVLVAGGLYGCDDQFCTDLATAELFDPASGRWSATGSLPSPREQQTATVLADGTVAAIGGLHVRHKNDVPETEIYDVATGTWSAGAAAGEKREGLTATLLASGWVLVAGGGEPSADLFQPAASRWVAPGAMLTPRRGATATLLADGSVLVAGGTGSGGTSLASAERYVPGKGPLVVLDPPSLSFPSQTVGSTSAPQTVTVLNAGTGPLDATGVAVQGAHPGDYVAETTCSERPVGPGHTCTITVTFTPRGTMARGALVSLLDAAPGSPHAVAVDGYGIGADAWAPTGSLALAREQVAAVRLSSGKVLVAGGDTSVCGPIGDSELFDPATGAWSPTGSLTTPRGQHALVALANGDVLAAGGVSEVCGVVASAEIYAAASGTWSPTAPMPTGGDALTGTLLGSGQALVTGAGATGQVYDPATASWSLTGPMVVSSRHAASALLMPSGHVLVTGGGTAVTELYDPRTNAWTPTGSLNQVRDAQSAVLLPSGEALVTGGQSADGGTVLSSTEIYDPHKKTWSFAEGLETPRSGGTATLLPDGTVLLAGGKFDAPLASSLVYDPAIGYWYPVGAMTTPREWGAAVLLQDGRVLALGGSADGERPLATAELFTTALLSATPAQGVDGAAFSLAGTGFNAGDTVSLRWDQASLGAVQTDATGAFTAPATVPAAAAAGAHTLYATGSSGPSASTTFLVTP